MQLAKLINHLVGKVAFITLVTVGITQPGNAVVVNFESDAAGFKPNGFVSNDSPLVSFSDSIGADLLVDNFTPQSINQGLAVFSDDASSLILDFAVPVDFLSLVFGNDDPGFSAPGNLARLEIFNGATLLDTVDVVLNRNDIADQTISFGGDIFNRATFTYVNSSGTPINLIEVVDDVTFTPTNMPEPVPEPASTLGILAIGALGGGSLLKRKQQQMT